MSSRFLRYGIVGIVVNLLGYGLFIGLIATEIPPPAASGICYIVAVMLSYIANRYWSFRSKRSHYHDIWRYLLSYGTGLLVAIGAMQVLLNFLHPALAQIVVVGFTAVVIYLCLELLRFGQPEKYHAGRN